MCRSKWFKCRLAVVAVDCGSCRKGHRKDGPPVVFTGVILSLWLNMLLWLTCVESGRHYRGWREVWQHPPLCNYMERVQLHPQDWPGLLNQKAEHSVAGHSIESGTSHHRLIKHLQHGDTDVEGPEPLQWKELTLILPLESHRVPAWLSPLWCPLPFPPSNGIDENGVAEVPNLL